LRVSVRKFSKAGGKDCNHEVLRAANETVTGPYAYAYCCSYDTTRGIIYQTALLTYEVKGDSQGRKITVFVLAVVHKQAEEEKVSGIEIYAESTLMKEGVKEVLSSRN
ncbi:hypothetical protein FRC07_013202, partial [Ceratobasidium sp. 392]